MTTGTVVNLDALAGEKRAIAWQGQTYPVRSLTMRVAKMIDAAGATAPDGKMQSYLDVVSALVPDLPQETVEDLTVAQVMAIIQLANPDYQGVPDVATEAEPEAAS